MVRFPLLLLVQASEHVRGILPAPSGSDELAFEVTELMSESLHRITSLLRLVHLFSFSPLFLQRHYTMIRKPVEGPQKVGFYRTQRSDKVRWSCYNGVRRDVSEPEPRVRPPMRSTPRGLLRGRRCALPHFSPRNDGETQ